MVGFTASRDDFKLYFACPRKLGLKTMGIKVREVCPTPRVPLSHAIGISGEKLTEEILEIIASIQADSSKGEYVKVFKERSKSVGESLGLLKETLGSVAESLHTLIEELKSKTKATEELVESTVTEAFKGIETRMSSPELSMHRDKLRGEMNKGFLNTFKGMLEKIPKIEAVYKPTLRNRDTCSLGIPDYQVETVQGHILIEVKNMQNLDVALDEGKDDLLYYNSLLTDLELGDSIWGLEKLPNPTKSLIVVPRHGVVKEVSEPIPNFREIAVEIWKIKRAALVDGVLPDTKLTPSICNRCQYRRFCEKKKVEQLEPTKPIPLIYAVAEHEAKENVEKPIETPTGFWLAYSELRRRAEQGNEEAKAKLNYMDEYLNRLYREKVKIVYRAMRDEFDSWGGIEFLTENYASVTSASHRLYKACEKNVEVILRVAKKRWGI